MTGRTPLLLDCDPGIDDSLAILHLVERWTADDATVDLRGIVCTAGNVGVDDSLRATLSWLDLCGAPEVPVARGAEGAIARPHPFTPETHGPRGVGYASLPDPLRHADPRDGAELWVDLARERSGELVAVLTGPSSTLARALELEPELPRLLKRLVVMGGTFRGHSGNTTPVSEWNVDVDPEAADAVCLAWERCPEATPVLWCGLDVTEQALWTPAHTERLRAAVPGSALVDLVDDALRFYFEFHESVGEGYLAQVHDPAVAWVALHLQSVTDSRGNLRVECAGEHTRGMTVLDTRGIRRRPENAAVVTGVEGGMPAVVDEVVESLGRLARRIDGVSGG